MIDSLETFFMHGMKRSFGELKPAPSGLVLNVGCGLDRIPGTISVDKDHVVLPEIVWDADRGMLLPYEDVAGIHAHHFLEHVADPINVLEIFDHALAPGGVVWITVPYGTSNLAVGDLTHKHFFNEDTFRQLLGRRQYYNNGGWNTDLEITFQAVVGQNVINMALLTQLQKSG